MKLHLFLETGTDKFKQNYSKKQVLLSTNGIMFDQSDLLIELSGLKINSETPLIGIIMHRIQKCSYIYISSFWNKIEK